MSREKLKDARQQVAELEQQLFDELKATADILGITIVKADNSKAPAPKLKRPPKYSDGNGNTWTGKGKRPGWLLAKLDEGAKLEDFAIA
jgi:DNA-binding protein H-NS